VHTWQTLLPVRTQWRRDAWPNEPAQRPGGTARGRRLSTTTLEPTQDLPGPLQHDGSALLLLLLGQQHFLQWAVLEHEANAAVASDRLSHYPRLIAA
jgi:hypothetical protein